MIDQSEKIEPTGRDVMHSGLVKKSKQGDGTAFAQLIRLYEKDLYRVGIAIMKNDNDALDCIQETILSAYKNIGKLAQEEYFKTWLLKILINKCSDSLKRRERQVPMVAPQSGEQRHGDANDLDIKAAINRLDKELKLVVILYYYEDMNVVDISQSLNIPPGTVKSRLYRARERLRQFLRSEERGVL